MKLETIKKIMENIFWCCRTGVNPCKTPPTYGASALQFLYIYAVGWGLTGAPRKIEVEKTR
jgi:hypothetical protein